jgi:Peptidase family M23
MRPLPLLMLVVAALAHSGVLWAGEPASIEDSQAFPPPPSFAPLVTQVVAAPSAVLGTDERQHLVYEVSLLNTSAHARRMDAVEVLDDGGRVLASYTGPDAVKPIMSNAVAHLAPVDVLPSSGGGVLWLDVSFARDAAIPDALVHRFTTTPLTDGGAAAGPESPMIGARTAVNPRAPAVLGPPLRGAGYVDGDGCCGAGAHTRALLPIDGNRYLAQRYAIDWVRIDDGGFWWRGDPAQNESYLVFGDAVYSATAGVVVSTRDDLPENTPPHPLPDLDVGNALGNHVIVDLGDGRFATYAHLQPGSVQVSVGERVHRGQHLGRVGNTGSSSAPHLHFHVTDSAAGNGIRSNGVPYVFERFWLTGTVLNLDEWGSQEVSVPAEIGAPDPPPRRRHQLPLQTDIVTFP